MNERRVLISDLVGAKEIGPRLGVSQRTVLSWLSGERRSGSPFPKPVKIVSRVRIWDMEEVETWYRDWRPEKSGRKIKPVIYEDWEAEL